MIRSLFTGLVNLEYITLILKWLFLQCAQFDLFIYLLFYQDPLGFAS